MSNWKAVSRASIVRRADSTLRIAVGEFLGVTRIFAEAMHNCNVITRNLNRSATLNRPNFE